MLDSQPELQPAPEHTALPSFALRWRLDTSLFSFETTAELEPLEGIIGQRRALEAMQIGTEIHSPGYNIFVNGL